jgi:hypothetical protein
MWRFIGRAVLPQGFHDEVHHSEHARPVVWTWKAVGGRDGLVIGE